MSDLDRYFKMIDRAAGKVLAEMKPEVKIPTEKELMLMFLDVFDGDITPSWDKNNQKFIDVDAQVQYEYFKKGYMAAYGGINGK